MSSHKPNVKVNPVLFPLVIVLVFVFSFIGHQAWLHHEGKPFDFFGVVYATICFFLMHHVSPVPENTPILIAQYLAALLICTSIFSLVWTKLKKAYLVYRIGITYRNHIVIFRLNNIGKTLALELLKKGYKVIVVETDEHSPYIESVKAHGGVVFTEKPSDFKTLSMAAVGHSRVCILTSNRDEINIEVAGTLSSYLLKHSHKGSGETHKIMVHINNPANENILKDYFDIHNEDDHYDLETFNVYETAAKKIYDTYTPYKYLNPADKESENAIAVVGFNDVAEAFLVENMILGHYPDMEKLKIYLADENADTHFNYLNYKYPYFHDYVEIIPVKLLNGTFFANFTWSKTHIEKLSKVKAAYFFGPKDADLITAAASFRQFLYTQTLSITQVPIIVCLPEDTGVMDLLDSNRQSGYTVSQAFSSKLSIQTYRMISNTCTAESLIEESEFTHKLSKLINFFYAIKYEFASIMETNWNVKNAAAIADKLENELLSLPDTNKHMNERDIEKHLLLMLEKETDVSYDELYKYFSIEKHWHQLSYRKKDSNKYAARQVAMKVHAFKYLGCWPMNRENITRFYPRLAPIEHTRWCAEKMVFNFKYGPYPADKTERMLLKEVLKIHDQLVPYEKLTDHDKEKDLNIFLMVPVLNIVKPITE
jgi:hypothetical protein